MATEWYLNFPSLIQNTTGTSVVYSGSINQSGMLYMVILPEASGAPTADQIIAHTNASGDALQSGFYDSKEVAASGTTVLLSGYGLISETDYTAYFIASGYVDGLMADVHDTNFTTPDITPPSWSGEYPMFDAIYGTSGTFSLATTENSCSGWVLVVASGTTAPTAAAIKSSGTVVDMPSGGIVYNVTVTGLVTETAYTAYAVAQDASAVLQPTGYLVYTFMTADTTAPSWIATYPSIGSITTTTAVLSAKLNDDGDMYWVVVPSGQSTPSYSQIIAGQDSTGTAVPTGRSGNTTLVANVAKTANITNLNYGSTFTVAVVGRDDYENKTDPIVATVNFRTLVPPPGAPSNFYSAKNVAERRRRGLTTGTVTLR